MVVLEARARMVARGRRESSETPLPGEGRENGNSITTTEEIRSKDVASIVTGRSGERKTQCEGQAFLSLFRIGGRWPRNSRKPKALAIGPVKACVNRAGQAGAVVANLPGHTTVTIKPWPMQTNRLPKKRDSPAHVAFNQAHKRMHCNQI